MPKKSQREELDRVSTAGLFIYRASKTITANISKKIMRICPPSMTFNSKHVYQYLHLFVLFLYMIR